MASLLPISEKRPPTEKVLKEQEMRLVISVFLRTPKAEIELDMFTSFQDYYGRVWDQLDKGNPCEAHDIGKVDYKHLCLIVDQISLVIKAGKECHRPLLQSLIANSSEFKGRSSDSINKTIDLALRLWLAVYIRNSEYASMDSVQWNNERNLRDFVGSQFTQSRHKDEIGERVDKMTMAKLKKYSGIGVEWTDDLKEHLELNMRRRIVKVFRMKYYIYQLSQSDVEIIPKRVIEDYVTTMNLLFPSSDDDTMEFLDQNNQERLKLEGPTAGPGPVYLSDLQYWRDELLVLWVEFQSPAPSVRHLIYDRRNPLQWYTFIFAVAIFILTIIFGVISSVLTGLQTGYSYQSLLLAREAAAAPQICPAATCTMAAI